MKVPLCESDYFCNNPWNYFDSALQPLQAAAARIGHDLKIFQTLDAQGPQTLKELQALTGAHPLTLGALIFPDFEFC